MKTILTIILSAACVIPTYATQEIAKPKTKQVCVITIDAKTKQEVKKCKTIKIHKKHEGTAIPDSNKK